MMVLLGCKGGARGNVNRGTFYPTMLLTASFFDTRVGVWEAGGQVRVKNTGTNVFEL
ncbi:hypothetical protein HanRHA438_Chr06g0275281 [Helianthus annuus]|nr:hypothetical protein HanRHA438_Chr06g0275281 [Helianthus annuus]